jgi:hypothetical protein
MELLPDFRNTELFTNFFAEYIFQFLVTAYWGLVSICRIVENGMVASLSQQHTSMSF